ncbi:hypothetical protein CEXT_680091 [Caerostris extrusa]|uniref:Uncharacterized protein n=1 Tax=Caerostris extrusa TaxID=172846 RepID=A0AAV4VAH0_CAEEX|nr:hypothetical protein CEXT_680091 [Caerostris extrusa]
MGSERPILCNNLSSFGNLPKAQQLVIGVVALTTREGKQWCGKMHAFTLFCLTVTPHTVGHSREDHRPQGAVGTSTLVLPGPERAETEMLFSRLNSPVLNHSLQIKSAGRDLGEPPPTPRQGAERWLRHHGHFPAWQPLWFEWKEADTFAVGRGVDHCSLIMQCEQQVTGDQGEDWDK